MLYGLIQRVLLQFTPETAHAIVGKLLDQFQRITTPQLSAPAIRIPSIPTIAFRNRLGLAAGFDKNGEWPRALLTLGFGFLEVGTVTPLPQPGNPRPRLWRYPEREALVNRLGFNNCGLDEFCANLKHYAIPGPVLANIGKGVATPLEEAVGDYQKSLEKLSGLVQGFVVNVSSPNTEGLRSLQSTAFLDSLIPLLPKDMPVWIKLAPDLELADLDALCDRVNDAPAITGLVLTNTSRTLAKELYNFDEGGLSGRPLFTRALEMVGWARTRLKPGKTIIGVGGVSSAEDAQNMRSAGADLVEIYTGFIFGGPALVREIAAVLEA
ncbi:MAG: quinone-dependent dihydroorotate dehydrogenase [Deltaproteobacteria bacterium]|nr:quinone-dependent dihydroorotate dehydrogenase [Deltaproteobacteria bacterium]MBI3294628.1 quinone-dependent dihydroorotate dehydrogenase [Deltaproteobacteria bacterium]